MNPKLMDFCRHCGITPMPCRAYTPQHKGKVESGVAYVKGNALKGRVFGSLAAQNAHMLHWQEPAADKRIHGTGTNGAPEKKHLICPRPKIIESSRSVDHGRIPLPVGVASGTTPADATITP